MAREDSVAKTTETHRGGGTPAGVAYTFLIGTRPLALRERGPQSWPRIALQDRDAVVVRVRAYEGGRDTWAYPAAVEWTFRPAPDPTINNRPCDPRRVQHILNVAPLKWRGGRPRLERARLSDTLALALQARALLDEGRYSRLTDIAEYLGMATTNDDLAGEIIVGEHRKALRAAAERLRRGIERLSKLSGA